jgi:nitronate monooxygenase
MTSWRDRRILDLFGIELPIIQAPMAGTSTPDMAIAVSEAGGLGSLAVAQLTLDQARKDLATIRQATRRPINVNFFAHKAVAADAAQLAAWRALLAPYYRELGLDPEAPVPQVNRAPFDDGFAALVEETKPEVVSFHFGLPEQGLLDRVRATGAKVIASATTVAEARWLEERGVDAIVAMGSEAGGHRGNFLSDDMGRQVGTMALVPQIVDAVSVPVIAAGGIADARGIVAALALGAEAVQIGSAFLATQESGTTAEHRAALLGPARQTRLTRAFSGRLARGLPNRLMEDLTAEGSIEPYPYQGYLLAPIVAAARAQGRTDVVALWAGQASPLIAHRHAGELYDALVRATEDLLASPTTPEGAHR